MQYLVIWVWCRLLLNILFEYNVLCSYVVEPRISVWFEELSYTTEESSTTVSVCIVTSTTRRSFHVQIQPIPGTASGRYSLTVVYCSCYITFFVFQLMRTTVVRLQQLDLAWGKIPNSAHTLLSCKIMLWKM